MEKAKDSSKNKQLPTLSLRNFRDLIIICLLGVTTYKLFQADFSFNLQDFTFSDLLSILMSFFAIALSAVFYFKATDTSNRFYDNSYKFTKEISEIIGRMEAGFIEKLSNLDDGYSGLRERFDRFPTEISGIDVEAEKEKIKTDYEAKLTELVEQTQLEKSEKEALISKLNDANNKLDMQKKKLSNIPPIAGTIPSFYFNKESKHIENSKITLAKRIIHFLDDKENISYSAINKAIKIISHSMHKNAFKSLVRNADIEFDGELISDKSYDDLEFYVKLLWEVDS